MIETLRDTLDATRLCLDTIRFCAAALIVGDVLSFGVLIALLAAARGRGAGCPKPERPRKPQKAMRLRVRERPRKKRRKRKRRNPSAARKELT